MARLILKSPYIKSTGGASGYLRYIATRERVELIPDDRPPTRKQEQLIAKLVKDFPDSKTLYEYEDYLTKPTKVNASAFITLALEADFIGLQAQDLNLITAVLVGVALVLPKLKAKLRRKPVPTGGRP